MVASSSSHTSYFIQQQLSAIAMSGKKDISHLASFSYAPPITESSGSSNGTPGVGCRRSFSNQNTHQRKRAVSISNAEFVSANFKFIVCGDDGLYNVCNPDSPVPWQSLLAVVVSINSRDLEENKCPICLSRSPVLPCMCRCGHIFCACCITRYYGEYSYKKCPVCGESSELKDIKRVQFEVLTNEVKENKHFTFKLVIMNGMFPSDNNGNSIPDCDDIERAPYSRIVRASALRAMAMLAAEEQEIAAFRADCLAAADGIFPDSDVQADVELLPYLCVYQDIFLGRKEALTIALQRSSAAAAAAASMDGRGKAVALYQDPTGSMVFLHPLCVRCLLASVGGDTASLPVDISARVVELESIRVSLKDRDRYAALRHLPIHATVKLAEIDMTKLVGEEAHALFAEEFSKRKLRRQGRARKLKSEAKKFAKQQIREDSLIYAMRESAMNEGDRERDALADLLSGPSLCGERTSPHDATDTGCAQVAAVRYNPTPVSFAKATTQKMGFDFDFPDITGGASLPAGFGKESRRADSAVPNPARGKKTIWKKLTPQQVGLK